MLALPVLNGKPSFPQGSLIVELAPAPPAASPAPQRPAPAVEEAPPPQPTEEVRMETGEPVITEKAAVEEPQPQPSEPPGDEADDGIHKDDRAPGIVGGPADGHSIAPLEGGDLEYAWYRASVTAALYSNWQRPILSGIREPLEVSISFEINRDGSVTNLRIDSSSGVPSLDRSALSSVADASPLPPLPPQWREPRLSAVFVFRLYPEEL
jgi:protein TonB